MGDWGGRVLLTLSPEHSSRGKHSSRHWYLAWKSLPWWGHTDDFGGHQQIISSQANPSALAWLGLVLGMCARNQSLQAGCGLSAVSLSGVQAPSEQLAGASWRERGV